jgi:hypothetical protein
VASINEWVGHEISQTNDGGIFSSRYTGIDRCNIVLKLIETTTGLSESRKAQLQAEARFLRAIYYFSLKTNIYNVPWVDETIEDARVPNYEGEPEAQNYVDIWPNMFADMEFAMNNLPATQTETARPNSWAAQCYLAKFYIFAATYDPATYSGQLSTALTLLNDAINNGVTSSGDPYGLLANYHDNFDAATEHGPEYVWGVEITTYDGTPTSWFGSANAWPGGIFTGYWRDPTGPDYAKGWGFNQPTEWFANHFRTDARGLPYLDMFEGPRSSSDTLADDYGLDPAPAAFEVDTQGVDPRLDWSVGRRGIDFLGWGDFPGASWLRAQLESSPYGYKKFKTWEDQMGTYQSPINAYCAINMPMLRFSEVLLLAAECEARIGSLENARDHVNAIRQRMIDNSSSGRHWVKVGGRDGTVDAANYRVGLYDAAYADDPFASQAGALDVILYERTLELGAEGKRFYDLVRFGAADEELNNYLDFEKSLQHPNGGPRYGHYLASWGYDEPRDKFLPIHQTAIDRSKVGGVPTLIQNPGY